MYEVGCPICGYETVVFEEAPSACPECDRSVKRRLERRLEGHGVEILEDGPALIDVEEADKKREVFEMLGIKNV